MILSVHERPKGMQPILCYNCVNVEENFNMSILKDEIINIYPCDFLYI